LDRIKHLETIDAFHMGFAMQKGINGAQKAIAEPVEGTILDVVAAAGNKAYELAKYKKPGEKNPEKNIIKVLEEAKKAGQIALDATTEKLAVLKQNNVVDAGGLGFVKILEAWVENLKGQSPAQKAEVTSPIVQSETTTLKYPYEVVLDFKKKEDTDIGKIQQELANLGDSLEVIEIDDKIKLHIHTDQPEIVVGKFENFPEFEKQIEDMSGQSKQVERKPLGLVVDEIADLPADFLEKYEIEEVPFTTRFPNGEIVTSKEEIYPKMKEALKTGRPLPTTSAPSFKKFFSVYQKVFQKFEKFLVITVSSKLSGAYSSARIARSLFKKPEEFLYPL